MGTSTTPVLLQSHLSAPDRARPFVEHAIQAQTQGIGDKYNPLVNLIGQARELDLICHAIEALTHCTSLLSSKKHESIVNAILKLSWAYPGVADVVPSFILNVTSNNPDMMLVCMKRLIREFFPPEDAVIMALPEAVRNVILQRVHNTLSSIVNQQPTGTSCLLEAIAQTFPHKRHSQEAQRQFLCNTFRVLEYSKSITEQTMLVIIDRLIQIDVEIRVDDMQDDDGVEELCFNMEDSASTERQEQLELASKLDLMMNVCFEFAEKKHAEGNIQEYFSFLCSAFEKCVLTTYKSKYTQFLIFHTLSFGSDLVDLFLIRMLHFTMDGSKSIESRVAAACYVGSLLARGKFVNQKSHRTAIKLLVDWLHGYIGFQDSTQPVDVPRHKVFYTACQNLFYVLCYEFNGPNEDYFRFLRELRIDLVVSCHLLPLAQVFRGIAIEFARGSLLYQIVSGDAHRLCEEIQVASPGHLLSEPFFPFDPYLLKISSAHIEDLYRDWRQPGDDAVVDDDFSLLLRKEGVSRQFSGPTSNSRPTPPSHTSSMESDRHRFGSPMMNMSYESVSNLSASFTDRMSFEDASSFAFRKK